VSRFSRRDALKFLGLAGLSVAGCNADQDPEGPNDQAIFGKKCRTDALVGEAALTSPPELRRYEKVVVLMMENRSFDHYFGHLSLPPELGGEGRKDVDGLTGKEVQFLTREGMDGREAFKPFLATDTKLTDISHTWEDCHGQWNGGSMDGFIQMHFRDMATRGEDLCSKRCNDIKNPMAYYGRNDTPTLHQLFDQYTLCDRWFASVMGPTWPNRAFLHAATSTGIKENKRMSTSSKPSSNREARTIWHELAAKCISARNYSIDVAWALGGIGVFNNVPSASFFKHPPPTDKNNNLIAVESFEEACEHGTLPTVSIIDPAFILAPNDDHPPHDIKSGQAFIAAIYKLLTKNADQWAKTLFIITYDEHGSFFDHVNPPRVDADEREEFRQLGFRVPSLVIGPYVKKNFVSHVQYDHVSFLSTITRRFGLSPLNARVQEANDVRDCIDMNAVETANVPTPIALQSVMLSESAVHESIAESLGQEELAIAVNGGPATIEQKRRATDAMLAGYDRIGVATIRR
jgi:phospholipase C